MTPTNLDLNATDIHRKRVFIAAIGCIGCVAIAIGLLLPLLAITLDRMAISGFLIGLNTAMPALAGIVVGPFITPLIVRIGLFHALRGALIAALMSIPAYWIFLDFYLWFPIRFFAGATFAVLFSGCEAWINQAAGKHDRGRILGLYAAVFSAAFGVGPAILWLIGFAGILPYIVAFIAVLAAFPFLAYGRNHIDFAAQTTTPALPMRSFIRQNPHAMATALVFGAIEAGGFSFLVIYAYRNGFSDGAAALLPAFICLGGIVISPVIGAISDRIDRLLALLICSLICMVGAILIPFTLAQPTTIYTLVFVWGGAFTGLYAITLALMGERHHGINLVGVNVAFSVCYSIGATLGPIWFGLCLHYLPRHQIPIGLTVLTAMLAIYLTSCHWNKAKK